MAVQTVLKQSSPNPAIWVKPEKFSLWSAWFPSTSKSFFYYSKISKFLTTSHRCLMSFWRKPRWIFIGHDTNFWRTTIPLSTRNLNIFLATATWGSLETSRRIQSSLLLPQIFRVVDAVTSCACSLQSHPIPHQFEEGRGPWCLAQCWSMMRS